LRGLARINIGVAHAEPPLAGSGPVCYGGKGTPDLGSTSVSVRLGQACWGSCGRGVDEGRMTTNPNLKRRVRARSAKTGESYAAALRQVRSARQAGTMPELTPVRLTPVRLTPVRLTPVRLATAQVVVRDDPRDQGQLGHSGRDVRELMRAAHRAGARIIHFPEGATCSPHKRITSVTGPAEVGPADWDRADWQVLRAELAAIARLAGELRLWAVLGSVHPRFGCAMGLEVHFPEVFAEYERLDVDGVLISAGPGQGSGGTAAFATQAQAHAATNSLWVSFAMAAQHSVAAPAGTIAPDGRWAARCRGDGHPAVAIVDIDNRPPAIDIAVAKARPWRRLARAGAYDAHLVTEDRSEDRGVF
jgi:predicted amidohydrolase